MTYSRAKDGETIYTITRVDSALFNWLGTITVFFRDMVLILTLVYLNIMILVYFKRTMKRKRAIMGDKNQTFGKINENKNSSLERSQLLMVMFSSVNLIIGRITTLFIYFRLIGDYFGNSNGCFMSVGIDIFYISKIMLVVILCHFNRVIKHEVSKLLIEFWRFIRCFNFK